MFTTKKTKDAEAAIKKGHSAHSIGMDGTVEDINAALKKVEEHTATLMKAHRRVNAVEEALYLNLPKFQRLNHALKTAQEMPDSMRRAFVEGSCEAFHGGRPENIQYIFSHPSEFLPKYHSENSFVIATLSKLMKESTAPDTVINTAFADVPVSRSQELLDKTLINFLIGRVDEDITPQVSALLKAGANPAYNSSESLALALHKEMPAKIVDLLLNNKKSASLEDALQKMRDHRKLYGDTLKKIEARQQKNDTDARLRQMEETIKELTQRLAEKDYTSPAASTEQAGARKKAVKLIKPSGPQ